MIFKCYMCNKKVTDEHVFLMKYKGLTRVMCRKCGTKFRKRLKQEEKGGKDGDVDRGRNANSIVK